MGNYTAYIIGYGVAAMLFLVLVYLPVTNPFCWLFCVFAALVCAVGSIGYLLASLCNAFIGNQCHDMYAAKRHTFIVIITLCLALMFCIWLGFCVYKPANKGIQKEIKIDDHN